MDSIPIDHKTLTCMYITKYTYIDTHTHTHTHTYTHTHTHTHIYTYSWTYTYIIMDSHIYKYKLVMNIHAIHSRDVLNEFSVKYHSDLYWTQVENRTALIIKDTHFYALTEDSHLLLHIHTNSVALPILQKHREQQHVACSHIYYLKFSIYCVLWKTSSVIHK